MFQAKCPVIATFSGLEADTIYHEPFPCKTCAKGYIGCHAGCEEYLQAKEKYEAKRKKVMEAKAEQVQADSVTIKAIDHLLKKYHMKGR